jgi:hypothetical protein
VLILGANSLLCLSQTATKFLQPKAPELKLRILPNKEAYVLNEKVFTRTEFTNLTDKTLCFPEPAQGQQVPASGYLITEGEAPDAQERDRFIEVFDGIGIWQREKLLSEIEKNWIKVSPNAVYVTKLADAKLELQARGQWRLRTTYRPPEGSFHPAEFKQYLQSTAQTVGCTVPEISASADPVTVNVVPAPEQK